MREIILIAHNIRSAHNIGSLFRTAEGLGVSKLYLTGYTPYPRTTHDRRLPHLAEKIHNRIEKTALGSIDLLPWQYIPSIEQLLSRLQADGVHIVALEQTVQATPLPNYLPPDRIALLLGNEVHGIDPQLLLATDDQLVIPMYGKKESFNVVQAAAMALYALRFTDHVT